MQEQTGDYFSLLLLLLLLSIAGTGNMVVLSALPVLRTVSVVSWLPAKKAAALQLLLLVSLLPSPAGATEEGETLPQ